MQYFVFSLIDTKPFKHFVGHRCASIVGAAAVFGDKSEGKKYVKKFALD
jgi:hypothetical protein